MQTRFRAFGTETVITWVKTIKLLWNGTKKEREEEEGWRKERYQERKGRRGGMEKGISDRTILLILVKEGENVTKLHHNFCCKSPLIVHMSFDNAYRPDSRLFGSRLLRLTLAIGVLRRLLRC